MLHRARMHGKSLRSRPTLCDPRTCSLPGTSVRGIFQARVLEWVALPSFRALWSCEIWCHFLEILWQLSYLLSFRTLALQPKITFIEAVGKGGTSRYVLISPGNIDYMKVETPSAWRDVIINSKNHFNTQNTWELSPYANPTPAWKISTLPKSAKFSSQKRNINGHYVCGDIQYYW